jgi:general secretion pathway protein F
MPNFRYKAVAGDGSIEEGRMEATDRQQLVERLRATGRMTLQVDEVEPGAGPPLRDLFSFRRKGVTEDQVASSTRELSTLITAGLPLDRALAVLADLAEDERLKKLLGKVREQVRGGSSLADALQHHPDSFSRLYINMVRAGEAGGMLAGVLARLADYMEKARMLRESVVTALIYPIILICVAALSVGILLIFVVPQFQELFADMGKALPLPTEVVIQAGNFIRHYWWVVFVLGFGIVVLGRYLLSLPPIRKKFHHWLLNAPLFGDLVAKMETARLARTLGTLLANGVTLLNALTISREVVQNMVFIEEIGILLDRLKRGQGLATPMLEAGIFPRLAAHMVRVGEETGEIDAMLIKVADIYDHEVERAVKRMLTILEPLLILGLGVVIAAIIMAILLGILSVNELVG